MKPQKKALLLLQFLAGAVLLMWTACDPPQIELVEQPCSVEFLDTFEVDVSVYRNDYLQDIRQVSLSMDVVLPSSLERMATQRGSTVYTLIFGILVPDEWTVTGNFNFTGDDDGIFIYSDELTGLMEQAYPIAEDCHWWVAETSETLNTAQGRISFTPVLTAGTQPGNFYLTYNLGYREGNNLHLSSSMISGGIITCGLEDTVYVTSAAGSGPGSLREAIDRVDQGGLILFDLNLPATIYLSEQINIYKSVTIKGPENGDVWITAGNTCRIFSISDGREVNISRLKLVNGDSDYSEGGAIYCSNNTSGTIENVYISGCQAGYGGGIFLGSCKPGAGWLLENVEIVGCHAYDYGGGIYGGYGSCGEMEGLSISGCSANYGGGIHLGWSSQELEWIISGSEIRNNTATICGGGIYSYGNSFMSGTTIKNNLAGTEGGGIYGTQYMDFDANVPCSIFSNTARLGFDLYGGNTEIIRLAKFTVDQPNDYFTFPRNEFAGFMISEAVMELTDQDMFVSPSGSDSNSGTSPASPFRTISHALAMMYSDPDDPNCIHLAPGTYIESTNQDLFPLYAGSFIQIEGSGKENTFLHSDNMLVHAAGDEDFSISKVNLSSLYYTAIVAEQSSLTLNDFIFTGGIGLIQASSSLVNLKNGNISNNSHVNEPVIYGMNDAEIILDSVLFQFNNAKLLYLDHSYAQLNGCRAEYNIPNYGNYYPEADLIALHNASSLTLSGSTIRHNELYKSVIGIFDQSSVFFNPDSRCNIYGNCENEGCEIRTVGYTGGMINLVADTFDVKFPSDYFTLPSHFFTYDILNPLIAQVSQDLYVSPDGSDNNSGLTPETSLRTITKACKSYYSLEGARDTIHLAAGNYGEGENFPVMPPEGVTIKGTGRDETLFRCTLNNSQESGFLICYLQDITMKDLQLQGNYLPAIELDNGELHMDHCLLIAGDIGIIATGNSILTGDSAEITNGSIGLQVSDANLVVEDMSMLNCQQGAIISHNSTLECRNIRITDSKSYYSQGGLQVHNTQLVLLNSEIMANASQSNGGGLSMWQSEGVLINNLFSANRAEVNGGGIYINEPSGPITLINNRVELNKAQSGGGIYYNCGQENNQPIAFDGVELYRNNSSEEGGGMVISGGSPFLIGCRIEENFAAIGGGLFFGNCFEKSPYLSSTSILHNKAHKGGGVAFLDDSRVNLSWDDLNRCNIYLNQSAEKGADLWAGTSDQIYEIVLDTFTVACPCLHFACSLSCFDFDILNGFGLAGDYDVYVSPQGDNSNSGYTPEDPMKNLSHIAFKFCLDTLPPHRVFLSEGLYSLSSTGEQFPMELWGEMELTGETRDGTILDGEFSVPFFLKTDSGADRFSYLTFTSALSDNSGGLLYSSAGGTLEFSEVTVDSCTASKGGAIAGMIDTLKISHSNFHRNVAWLEGGAIALINTYTVLEDVTFLNNTASRGGAVNLSNISGVWKQVNFLENHAQGGGGAYIFGKLDLNCSDVRFIGNTASNTGGGMYTDYCNSTLRNMFFSGNQARYGGGLRVYRSDAVLYNLCFDGNLASKEGAAFYSVQSDVDADHLTIAGNENTSGKSAIFLSGSAVTLPDTINMKNLIYWGNPGSGIRSVACYVRVNNCDIEGGRDAFTLSYSQLYWQHANIDADPLFAMNGDHPLELLPGSPCIDAAMLPLPGQKQNPFDIRGNFRCIDGNGDGFRVEDMGAYEFEGIRTPTEEPAAPSNGSLVVFPNPVNSYANIVFSAVSGEKVRLDLCNLEGSLIWTIEVPSCSQGENKIVFNSEGLPPGIYFLRMVSENSSYAVKIVVAE